MKTGGLHQEQLEQQQVEERAQTAPVFVTASVWQRLVLAGLNA
jgi:hypothetical protein